MRPDTDFPDFPVVTSVEAAVKRFKEGKGFVIDTNKVDAREVYRQIAEIEKSQVRRSADGTRMIRERLRSVNDAWHPRGVKHHQETE